ncbi:MAG: glycosyltransferase family 39 protein [Nanoarchaeota archaeon]|nr:glycosyltransferase family 39 protein [Nanoarchaeota archaeon]
MKKINRLLIKILSGIVLIILLLLIIISNYIGSTDVGDYANVAKFFAGEYNAKIRSSHSYFYGFINSPFIRLTSSFIGMKIMSIVWILLIILSIYYISKKDKRFLILSLATPIFWYMAPWINPIQIASLFFLWGYHFIKRYDENNNLPNLIYSGLFIGMALVFWDTILYFGAILTVCFLYDKKLSHLFYFMVFVFIGLIPRLILDQIMFNFAFYGIFRNFFGGVLNVLGFTSGTGATPKSMIAILSVLLLLPLFSYLLIKPKNFKENKKTVFFLVLSLLLILTNPQIRYTLILTPIILLNLQNILSKKQLKIQIVCSIIISLLVIMPYVIQISYSTNAQELTSFVSNLGNITLSKTFPEEIIRQDLNNIGKDFPNQRFIVGNLPDDYSYLAMIYWGDGIKEFISIQDYELYLQNKTVILEKEFHPILNIPERREIWIKGGISARINSSELSSVRYAISSETETDLNDFRLVKSYKKLSVFEKVQ